MKKAVKFTYYLALFIVSLFTLAMLMTYFSEWIQSTGFFGDWLCQRCGNDEMDPGHSWGARHYWYYWMCVALFLLSLARIIVWAVWYWHVEDQKEPGNSYRY